ncbi:response regulator, partial [Geomonas sp.]|uniref:response regulator n=1 Tax=Geomonas sp. TaxID=2651584 RepID=UPI002B46C643
GPDEQLTRREVMTTALIIEDHPDNMVLIGRLLEKSGFKTLRAITGLEGCELAISERPDFIILDVQLPDIHGTEVLCRIRQELGHRIPVIAMTANALNEDRERMLAAGCNCYIEKPFDTRDIIAQIKMVIGEADGGSHC